MRPTGKENKQKEKSRLRRNKEKEGDTGGQPAASQQTREAVKVRYTASKVKSYRAKGR